MANPKGCVSRVLLHDNSLQRWVTIAVWWTITVYAKKKLAVLAAFDDALYGRPIDASRLWAFQVTRADLDQCIEGMVAAAPAALVSQFEARCVYERCRDHIIGVLPPNGASEGAVDAASGTN